MRIHQRKQQIFGTGVFMSPLGNRLDFLEIWSDIPCFWCCFRIVHNTRMLAEVQPRQLLRLLLVIERLLQAGDGLLDIVL